MHNPKSKKKYYYFFDVVFLAAFLIPLAAVTERWLQGLNKLLLTQDFVLEQLSATSAYLGFGLFALAKLPNVVSGGLFVVGICFLMPRLLLLLENRRFSRIAFSVSSLCIRVCLFIVMIPLFLFGLFPWWIAAAMEPVRAVFCGSLVACVWYFRARDRRNPRTAAVAYIALVSMSAILLFSIQYQSVANARLVAGERIYEHAAYDVAKISRDRLLALGADGGDAMIFEKGDWRRVPDAVRARHVIYESETKNAYIPNRQYNGLPTVSVIQEQGQYAIHLPGGMYAIDAQPTKDGKRLLVICEFGDFFVVDRETSQVVHWWKLGGMLYNIEVHPSEETAFVSRYAPYGEIIQVDLKDGHILRRRLVGAVLFRIAFDAQTGLLWATKPLTNEVLIFNQELNLVRRIKVGTVPRDIQVGPGSCVTIGGYADGSLTFVDRVTFRVVDRLRPPSTGPLTFSFGRGHYRSSDGEILLCNQAGIWRISDATSACSPTSPSTVNTP